MTDAGEFEVDLRSLIDVLGTNLYTSPGVYVREFLQNAFDAQADAVQVRAPIRIRAEDGTFSIDDSGVGMTIDQVTDVLGTIGASSKRDQFGFGSKDKIGQFGIGLLSGFLIGDQIKISTRADTAPPVDWCGVADGQVSISEGDRHRTGTMVTITARPDARAWVAPDRVTALAAEYTALNPTPVLVNGVQVNGEYDELFGGTSSGEDAARVAYCQDVFGFTPLDHFEVRVPGAGLHGIAYVRPTGGDLVARAAHRVYIKGLFVGEVPAIVPEWAYFVRVVITSTELTPTAAREGLARNDLFDEVSTSIGDQIVEWLTGLGSRPALRERFLAVHEQGVKALAAHRRELLSFVDKHCLFETNVGPMSLTTFRTRFGTLRYAGSVDDYRVLADILAGRGIGLINAGHAYETSAIRALVGADRSLDCELVSQQFLLSALATPTAALRDEYAAALQLARRAVSAFDCEVSLREFEPAAISALLLTDDSARIAQDRSELLSEVADEPDAWLAALAAIGDSDTPPSRPVLVLNALNPLIVRLKDLTDDVVAGALVRVVYSQALLRARRSVRVAAASELDAAITLLAELATGNRAQEGLE